MSIELTFDHYIITELNYSLKSPTIQSQEEELLVSSQGTIGIHKEYENFYIDLDTDIESLIEEDEYRNLQIRVRFYFSLKIIDESDENDELADKIKKAIQPDILAICEHMLYQVIKQITSIDYTGSIFLKSEKITLDLE